MKNFSTLIISALLLLTLSGCNETTNTSEVNTNSTTESTPTETTEMDQEMIDEELNAIKEIEAQGNSPMDTKDEAYRVEVIDDSEVSESE